MNSFRIGGVKYLRNLARPHLDNPLYFATEFLRNKQ